MSRSSLFPTRRDRNTQGAAGLTAALAAEAVRLKELLGEQKEAAIERACADSKRTSATWIAAGDHMVLLVVNAVSVRKPIIKTYVCQVLEYTAE